VLLLVLLVPDLNARAQQQVTLISGLRADCGDKSIAASIFREMHQFQRKHEISKRAPNWNCRHFIAIWRRLDAPQCR
jgi:hypothetical protein